MAGAPTGVHTERQSIGKTGCQLHADGEEEMDLHLKGSRGSPDRLDEIGDMRDYK